MYCNFAVVSWLISYGHMKLVVPIHVVWFNKTSLTTYIYYIDIHMYIYIYIYIYITTYITFKYALTGIQFDNKKNY